MNDAMLAEAKEAAERWKKGWYPEPMEDKPPATDAITDSITLSDFAVAILENPSAFDAALRAELTQLREKLAAAEASIADYQKHLGEIVTYGADAESLDKLLGQAVERYRAAEATLAKIAERVYSVDGPVREVTLRMALNDILNLASGETT